MIKYLPLLLLMVLIVSCSNPSDNSLSNTTANPIQSATEADSVQLTKIVYDFFKAFDDRNVARLEELLLPKSVIIHHDGVATTRKELIDIINRAQNWASRERVFKDFEFSSGGSIAYLGFINEVTFLVPDGNQTFQYNETWIFEKVGGKWYPIRMHYSLVTEAEHSEG